MLKNLPITSQFMILYLTIKHKTKEDACSNEEFEFVMDFLLSHTMGQMFNIRLYAQYLATKLYEINKSAASKYTYIITVIGKTFIESAKDKNFIKLQEDYFVNNFDIVNDFTPSFIYYFLPRYCEINNNEYVDFNFVKEIMKNINANVKNYDFFKKMELDIKSDEEIFDLKLCKDTKSKIVDCVEESGTIQKKYIPWRNMSDINVYETGKKVNMYPKMLIIFLSMPSSDKRDLVF